MMTQAFYTGISGLQSNQIAIDVLSDNLANTNTPGYRGYTAEFASLFENMISTPGSSPIDNTVGVGTHINATKMDVSQGSLLLSDAKTDLAIDGNGWFGIEGNGTTMYTRAGSFTFDANSDLVTNDDSFFVLGTMGQNIQNDTLTYPIDTMTLGAAGAQEKLRFPKVLKYPPIPTSEASFFANLGLDESVTTTISASVIDPQSNKNQLKLTFTKSAVQDTTTGSLWDVEAIVQSLDAEKVYDIQSGKVSFDERGALLSSTLGSVDNNGASVAIDLGTSFSGVTAIDNIPLATSSSANGTIGGDLMGYEINQNAEVIATFTNGLQSSVGKIALYHFQNDQGLTRITGTRFMESPNSGEPLFYTDAEGNSILGANVINSKMEGSNVRLEVGLTELIILQRSYDANSKSIKTADEMMQKALNMDA